MNCNWKLVDGTVYVCANAGCGRTIRIEQRKPKAVKVECRGDAKGSRVPDELAARARDIAACELVIGSPPYGPGTEFRKLAASFGYEPKGCACNATEAKMNRLGADGCRNEKCSLGCEIIANAAKQGVTLSREMAWYAIDEACRLAELNAPQTTGYPAA